MRGSCARADALLSVALVGMPRRGLRRPRVAGARGAAACTAADPAKGLVEGAIEAVLDLMSELLVKVCHGTEPEQVSCREA